MVASGEESCRGFSSVIGEASKDPERLGSAALFIMETMCFWLRAGVGEMLFRKFVVGRFGFV